MSGAPVFGSAALRGSSLFKRGAPSAREIATLDFSAAGRTAPQVGQPGAMNRQLHRFARWAERRPQRSPDRAQSIARRRTFGGSGRMPESIRHLYTEGQRSALAIIALEFIQRGVCALPLDEIAAKAGVSRTTVQNALREARTLGHVSVQERPRKGRKSLTNVVRIIAREWLLWLQRGPKRSQQTGFKSFHPTKSQNPFQPELSAGKRADGDRCARGSAAKGLSEQGKGRSRALKSGDGDRHAQ